jgi:hypothetical protein
LSEIAGDGWVQVAVVVPATALRFMHRLCDASGVTLDGFIGASLILRARSHEGQHALSSNLASLARQIDGVRPNHAIESR